MTTCNDDLTISFGDQRENKSRAMKACLGSDDPKVFISKNGQPHLKVFTTFKIIMIIPVPRMVQLYNHLTHEQDAALNFALCKRWRRSLPKRCEIRRRGGENQHQCYIWFDEMLTDCVPMRMPVGVKEIF